MEVVGSDSEPARFAMCMVHLVAKRQPEPHIAHFLTRHVSLMYTNLDHNSEFVGGDLTCSQEFRQL